MMKTQTQKITIQTGGTTRKLTVKEEVLELDKPPLEPREVTISNVYGVKYICATELANALGMHTYFANRFKIGYSSESFTVKLDGTEYLMIPIRAAIEVAYKNMTAENKHILRQLAGF